jgi:uncharacterized damage-inducible protein DinB
MASVSETLLAEFDREASLTRRLIERIPPDKLDWRPHPKSTTMGGLGRHLAHMVAWAPVALTSEEFDIAARKPMPPTSTIADILSIYDANVAETRSLIRGQSDEELNRDWALTAGGRRVVVMPRAAVVTSMVVHHMIHHRGQLSVYLRLNDVPVPSIYGPSADEAMT